MNSSNPMLLSPKRNSGGTVLSNRNMNSSILPATKRNSGGTVSSNRSMNPSMPSILGTRQNNSGGVIGDSFLPQPASFKRRGRLQQEYTKRFEPLEACFEESVSSASTDDITRSNSSEKPNYGSSLPMQGNESSQFLIEDNKDDPMMDVLRMDDDDVHRNSSLKMRTSSKLARVSGNASKGSLSFYVPRSSSRSSSRKTSQLIEALTIDKLQLTRLSLYGRDDETKTLQACWDRVKSTAWEGEDDSHSASNLSDSFRFSLARHKSVKSFRASKRKTKKREFVLLSGYSGTGKSALIRQLEKPVEDAGGFFAFGKFDSQKRGEPYYGVATACRELCLAVTHMQDRRRVGPFSSRQFSSHALYTKDEISNQIKKQLGPDIKVLTRLLPILNEILGVDSSDEAEDKSSSSENEGVGMLEERNRFNYAFRRFLRVMASFGPVVLILDDMQWSDVASMDLLEYLIHDVENSRLMVVGLYRSNEVDDAHLLTKMIREIEYSSKEHGVNVTKLELGNLSVQNVNELLEDLLYTEPEESMNLAEIVHRKTSGNVFFVIQFLLALNMHDLLKYDYGLTKWRWNEANVENWTAATANVVDLMCLKLKNLDEKVSSKLPLVAFLGATFENRLLSLVFGAFEEELQLAYRASRRKSEILLKPEIVDRTKSTPAKEMLTFLEVCIAEGIMEPVGKNSHRWIHDKIQEAALSLISDKEQKEWRLTVGRILKKKLSPAEIEKNLFLIVNLFLDAIELVPPGDAFRLEVSKFFLRAGKKAQASSAFRQAVYYLVKGIELLPENHWTSQYRLSLDLFSSVAEAEYCIADIDRMEEHCQVILAQSNAPLEDKFRCYLVLVEGPARRNDLKSAIDMTLSILRTFGCTFPCKTFHGPAAFARLFSWKNKLKHEITEEQIHKLDRMTDAKQIFCMHLLEKMDPFCYISGNLNLFIMVVLKRIEWTITCGFCLHSASAFSSIGIVYTGALADIGLGFACAKYCLALQDKMGARSRAIESGNFLRCYGLNLHQTTPLMECMKGLLNGYQVGLEMGDLTSAMFGVYQYLELCRASGKPLELLDVDYSTYVKQMKEAHQLQALDWALVEHQGVLNLMGRSENTTLLTGEAMDQQKVLATVAKTNNQTLKYLILRKQMYLACFFGEHKLGADLAIKHGEAALKVLAGSNGAVSQCFLSALSGLSAYRKTKRGKYKKLAKAMTFRIRDWIKKGNPNISHFGSLLDAEWATLEKAKRFRAAKHFELANKIAARSGCIHDRALINERHGEYLLDAGTDNDEAEFRMREAMKLYSEWGAVRKIQLLCGRYKDIFYEEIDKSKRRSTHVLSGRTLDQFRYSEQRILQANAIESYVQSERTSIEAESMRSCRSGPHARGGLF